MADDKTTISYPGGFKGTPAQLIAALRRSVTGDSYRHIKLAAAHEIELLRAELAEAKEQRRIALDLVRYWSADLAARCMPLDAGNRKVRTAP